MSGSEASGLIYTELSIQQARPPVSGSAAEATSPRRRHSFAPIRSQGRSPETITLDGYAASHRAVRELQPQGALADLTKLCSLKYRNNLIEQDHRNVKSRLGAVLGLKSFDSAPITIRGVV